MQYNQIYYIFNRTEFMDITLYKMKQDQVDP